MLFLNPEKRFNMIKKAFYSLRLWKIHESIHICNRMQQPNLYKLDVQDLKTAQCPFTNLQNTMTHKLMQALDAIIPVLSLVEDI